MSKDVLEIRLSRRAFAEIASGVLAASIAGAPTEPSATVDPAIVDYFTAHRALLVSADNRLGSTSILPTARHQIGLIAQFRRQSRGRLRQNLLSTEARWAEFAGWLSDDLGNPAVGTEWLDLAMSMSQESGDAPFVAYILARRAQRAIGTTDQDRVVGLAQAAANINDAPPLVNAFGAVQEARGHALLADEHAFQRSIEHARNLVANTTTEPDALGSFCTPAYIHAHEAEGWLSLDNPRASVDSFDKAIAEWPSTYQRDRALFLARAAYAHLAIDNPDRATTLARQALPLAITTRSARVRRQVETVATQAAQRGAKAAAQDLLDALAGTA